ncbi:MAG: amino acid ABC transporter substrate-binding protein [Actinobacteria bacterium]|nr:MAG: amino acid ABC transporter substrate-binding protein [Actinomycetota bacterium]
MEPSTDRPDGGRSRQLRRYGPLVAIVVIAAVVGAVVLLTSGGDNKKQTVAGGEGNAPTGAISFSQAKKKGLDVEFSKWCDKSTGRIAMPYFFRPECYANVKDNGGATAQGVTKDTIKVVVYLGEEHDPIIDFITAAIKNNDTTEQVKETYLGYDAIFGSLYQTYGRKVQIEFVQGTGTIVDEVAARADAQRAIAKRPFIVWGGPAGTSAWADELAANKVICLSCTGGAFNDWWEQRDPYAISVIPSGEQVALILSEFVEKQLAGRKAVFAGDRAFQARDRKFGAVYAESGAESARLAGLFKDTLAAKGVQLAEQIPYTIDPARLQEQGAAMIGRLKAAGVTTVFFTGDPIAPRTFTEEATRQEYFPEWVINGSILTDVAAFGRTYDQRQWAHAFGITAGAARVRDENGGQIWKLHEWYHGKPPAAKDTYLVLWFQPAVFYAALQTFRDGLFAGRPTQHAITQVSVSWGRHGIWPKVDYNGVDDFTLLWWDPQAEGPDEIRKPGKGLYQYVDGGKRYLLGQFPRAAPKMFDRAGAVALYPDIPAAERPPDYPPPSPRR